MESTNDYGLLAIGSGRDGPRNSNLEAATSKGSNQDLLRLLSMINGPGKRFPISTIVTAADIFRDAEKRATNITEHWKTLREVLRRHEVTIQCLWTKKSKKQRLKTLLEPYVNQDDLARPKSLLLLMNARGRHLPSAFAAADADGTKFGFAIKVVVPVFVDSHTMILNGVTKDSLADYGKDLAWEDDKHAYGVLVSGKQFTAGEGLLVLEIQDRLLAFLVGCCREILHDIPAHSLVSDQFPIQPEPAMGPNSEAVGFESLSVMAAKAPYRVPAELDLAKIESLLVARAGTAEDRPWVLREDPLYFSHQLLESREHRPEILNDAKGKPHPTTKGLQADRFWTVVLGDFLSDVFLHLDAFSKLRQQAGELRAMEACYGAVISPTDDLPDDYSRSLLRFRHYLNWTATCLLQQLKLAGPGSPALRHMFLRNVSTQADNRLSLELCLKPGAVKTEAQQNLLWLFNTLWSD